MFDHPAPLHAPYRATPKPRLSTSQKRLFLFSSVAPLALSACGGGGSSTPAEQDAPPYEVEELPTYTLDELQAAIAGTGEITLPYALTVDFAEIPELENLDSPDELAPERLEITGSLTVPASDDDPGEISDSVHFVGASLSITAEPGNLDEAQFFVSSEYPDEPAMIVMRDQTTVTLDALAARLAVRDLATLDVVDGSSIALISRDLDVPDDFPTGARLDIGRDDAGAVSVIGDDSTITLVGHRAQIVMGSHSGEAASLTISAGGLVEIESLDFGPEITSAPTARIEVGRSFFDTPEAPAKAVLVVEGARSLLDVAGNRSEIFVGNNDDSVGELFVRDGGAVNIVAEAIAEGDGSARLVVGNYWDGRASAGEGTASISGANTVVSLRGHEATVMAGQNTGIGDISITAGATLGIVAEFDAASARSFSGAQFGIGAGGGTGTLLVSDAGTRVEMVGHEAIFGIGSNFNPSSDLDSSGAVTIRSGASVLVEGRFDPDYDGADGSYGWALLGRNNNDGSASLTVDGAGSTLIVTGSSAFFSAGRRGSNADVTVSNGGTIEILTNGETVSGNAAEAAGVSTLVIGSFDPEIYEPSSFTVTGANSSITQVGEKAVAAVAETGTLTIANGGLMIIHDSDEAEATGGLSAGIVVSGADAKLVSFEGTIDAPEIEVTNGASLVGAGLLKSTSSSGIVIELGSGTALFTGDGIDTENATFGEIDQSYGTLVVEGRLEANGATLHFEVDTTGQDKVLASGRVDLTDSIFDIETDLTEAFTLVESEVAIALNGATQVIVNGTEVDAVQALSIVALDGGGVALQVNIDLIA